MAPHLWDWQREAEMSDTSWVLRGIDAGARQQASDAAARLGVSLADYLTDVLLRGAPAPNAPVEAEPSPWPPEPPRENFALRRRLEALERRVGISTDGLGASLQTLDGAVSRLAAQLAGAEALAGDTAEALNRGHQELSGNLAAFRKRLGDAEENTDTLDGATAAALADLAAHADALHQHIDAVGGGAQRMGAALIEAHEALKYAVADDFTAFAGESEALLAAGLDEMSAAAEAAAEHSEAAVGRVMCELRTLREAIEDRMVESAAETRARMQKAFADAAGQLAALAGRVADNEHTAAHAVESVRAQIGDAGHAAQTALEATAQSLRQADAALATANANLSGRLDGHAASVADLSAFTRDSVERLDAGLGQMRATADAAAERAGAEAANLVSETRAFHDSIENRLIDSAAETYARMQTAAAEAAGRLAALAERVADNEQVAAQSAEKLCAQIADAGGAAQIAIADTAKSLRHADAMLAAEFARTAEDSRAALAAAHADFAGDIHDLRERQRGSLARLKCLDAALDKATGDLTALGQTLDLRLEERGDDAYRELARVEAGLSARLDGCAADAARNLAQADQAIGDDIARVEACTMAALEKLAHDIAEGDGLLAHGLEAAAQSAEDTRQRNVRQIDGLREQQAAALAPVTERLAGVEGDFGSRLTRLEHATEQAETAQALAVLRKEVSRLALLAAEDRAGQSIARRIDDLGARLEAQEARSAEAADRVHGVAHMLERVAAQSADGPATNGAIAALEQGLADFDLRQSEAFETLRAEIAHFIAENDRRLAALEDAPSLMLETVAETIEARLAQIEHRDVAIDFEELRRRMEERILSVENRSVRALEQVGETVALIEKRFVQGEDAPTARSA